MTSPTLLLNLLLAGAVLLALILACLFGTVDLGPGAIMDALLGRGPLADQLVVWEIRLPRALAAFAVGASLGISGAALQGLLRNPLAEPGVLGVSATAALCASCTLYYGLAAYGFWILPSAAVAGALGATGLLAVIATRTPSIATLLLVGIGLSSIAGAAMSVLLNLAPTPFYLADLINWTLGSVTNRSLTDLFLLLPFMVTGGALLLANRRGLTALSLGEEAAQGLGLDVPRHRLLIVLGTGLATGAAVALAGAIGFVGIVAPHLVRPFTGFDPARTLLPAAATGGLLLILADIGVRILPTTNELKLGVVAALIGAPVFIGIALKRRAANG